MTRWECKVNTDHLRVDCALQNSVTAWLEITCFEYIANNLPILSVKTNLTVFFWLCWRMFWFFSFLLSNLKCLQKWLIIKSTRRMHDSPSAAMCWELTERAVAVWQFDISDNLDAAADDEVKGLVESSQVVSRGSAKAVFLLVLLFLDGGLRRSFKWIYQMTKIFLLCFGELLADCSQCKEKILSCSDLPCLNLSCSH